MKNIPIVVKVIINIIFFVTYSIIGIIGGDFLYGLAQVLSNKPVAGMSDPIHTKIATISVLIILLLTGLFRKYFYLALFVKQEIEKKEKSYTQKVKQTQETEKTEDIDEKMKIYIDKEIK